MINVAVIGTGYIGLRAMATGLPAWFLLNPRQATAQTLERLRQDVELRERTQGAVGAWLAGLRRG